MRGPPRRMAASVFLTVAVAFTVFVVLFLLGCGSSAPDGPDLCVELADNFYRCRDPGAGVTCWWTGDYRAGMSCLRDEVRP